MSGFLGLLLDGIIVLLLALTIASVWGLSAKLKYVRDSRQQFEGLIKQFDESTRRADSSIKALQAASSKTGEELQENLNRARKMRDELSIMLDSAESLANRLEQATPQRSSADVGSAKQQTSTSSSSDPVRDVRSKAEMDLLRAIGSSRKEGGV